LMDLGSKTVIATLKWLKKEPFRQLFKHNILKRQAKQREL
jgi:hypothetical protein